MQSSVRGIIFRAQTLSSPAASTAQGHPSSWSSHLIQPVFESFRRGRSYYNEEIISAQVLLFEPRPAILFVYAYMHPSHRLYGN